MSSHFSFLYIVCILEKLLYYVGASFQLVEGTLHDKKDKRLVRIQCTHDNTWLPLCPPHLDLRTIMMEHTLSKAHAMAIQKEKGPIIPATTGLRGRPKKCDGRDPKQQSLSSFLVSTSIDDTEKGVSHQVDECEKTSGSFSFILNSLLILCWGFWNETINVGSKVVGVKPLLDDQRNGKEWFCEPQTRTILKDKQEEYSINGCF